MMQKKEIHGSGQACWRFCLMLVMLMTCANAVSWAQSTQGVILGTVKDTEGALVPGAQVTLTNMDEGIVRTAESNDSGNFQFLDAKTAHYNVTVTAKNFDKWETTGVVLATRQQLRFDVTLKLGSVLQEVVISGDKAGAIETETNSISAVYTQEDAQNLPVNNRAGSGGTSGLSLIATLPGVQSEGGTYSLQGGLPFASEVAVDGITIQNAGGGNSPIADAFPSTEAISELRTDGVGNNAEFGQPGEVSIITKGGSNRLHGSAFWYHQNAAFDSIPFGATTKPHKVGNTFGAAISGPVVIPHLYNGHNKTFFFGDYEGYRFPQQTPSQQVVPTAAMKRGDLPTTSLLSSMACLQTLLLAEATARCCLARTSARSRQSCSASSPIPTTATSTPTSTARTPTTTSTWMTVSTAISSMFAAISI
jgi:hypothetical protein